MLKKIFYVTVIGLGVMFLNTKSIDASDTKKFDFNNILFANNIVLEYGEEVDFNKFHIEPNIKISKTNYNPKTLGENEVSIFIETDKSSYKVKRNVVVKDTKNPIVEVKSEKIYVTKGNKYDLKNNIKSCSDPIDGEIVPEIIGTVDFNKVGEYEIQVKATDANKNSTVKTFKVVIKNEEVVPQHIIENSSSKRKQHYINVSNLQNSFSYRYTAALKDAIFSGNYDAKFPYEVDDYEFQYSVWEFQDTFLDGQSGYIYQSRNAAENYYYIEIKHKEKLEALVKEAKMKTNAYRNYVKNALNNMELNCSDAEMVQQINNYIVKNFSYKITNIHNVRSFVELGYGQCWHYANLFRDMCRSVGINVRYIEGKAYGSGHAWNSVVIDGKKYYFDVTLNDSMKTNKWSFVSEATLRQTHSW